MTLSYSGTAGTSTNSSVTIEQRASDLQRLVNSSVQTWSTIYSTPERATNRISVAMPRKGWITRLFSKKKDARKYTTDEFFSLIKRWASKLTTEKANKYRDTIINHISQASILWQKSVIEKLEKQSIGLLKEIQIINELWLTHYVYESDIADLENIGIWWRTLYRSKIEDYQSIIPQNCVETIVKVQERRLFDEIVILYTRNHERPVELDTTKKTKRPPREKVDPICFGKVTGTGRLFFICDWMDDECELTMKKLEKEIDAHDLV